MDIQARIDAIRQLHPTAPEKRRQNRIEDLVAGGFVTIEGKTYQVKSVGYYLDVRWKDFSTRKTDYWVTELELFNLHTGERAWLEWEVDDGLEISLTESLVTIREIHYHGNSLTHAALEEIADEEAGEVTVNGSSFHYVEDDTWAGRYSKDKRKDGLPMRAYEFEGSRGRYLTIEAWHEDGDERPEREAFLSKQIRPTDMEILQLACVT
ncbi:MAG: hypothetical protein CSB48_07200 [Proteobacteria bacterium]|nr:MAG: hypothetical protein CSB48_07200 [Pseudomonadota bacterium]PIE40164.1 MAG: hypothetical protein CSA51_02015 [Gammaproteobacteria bacterium]